MAELNVSKMAAYDGLTLKLQQLSAQMTLVCGEDFSNLPEESQQFVHGGMMDMVDDCLKLAQQIKP